MRALRKKRAFPPAAKLLPRLGIFQTPTGFHGGIDPDELDRLGLDAGKILDFSVNINPFGPAPGVAAVLANVPLDRYPDPEARILRRALAAQLNVSPGKILAGNGVSELIWLVALTFLGPGSRVMIVGPTYSEYARASSLMEASVTTVLARPDDDFMVRPDQFLHTLRRFRPRVVFLCNPNNPTGAFLNPEHIAVWARKFPGTLFVVDEAYWGFIPELCSRSAFGGDFLNAKSKQGIDNLLLLRSMTKDLGLAGLRLGYAIGSAEVIGWLSRAKPPWSVNALAQAAGVEALRYAACYQDSLKMLLQAKVDLVRGLTNLGCKPVPSAVPFFLLPVGNGAAFRHSLLQKNILVRDGASFGLPQHVRIGTRRPEDNARLLAVLGEVAHAG